MQNKQYHINQSPLYKLSSKAKLSKLLHVKDIDFLTDDSNYSIFTTKKGRKIEHPKNELKQVHKKIKILLSRIDTPSYLFSGKKGVSYVNNAKVHSYRCHLLKMDISKFYPNSKIEYIFRLFHYKFLMPEDIAWLLSNLVTCEGHIPTGSPLSQILAYLTFSDAFDKVNQLAIEKKCIFSLYVDDMTLSSDTFISKKIAYEIQTILKDYNLVLSTSKTKRFSPNKFKVVTGCVIDKSGMLNIPNTLHFRIHKLSKQLKDGTLINDKLPVLLGLLNAAKQIDNNAFCSLYRMARNYNA